MSRLLAIALLLSFAVPAASRATDITANVPLPGGTKALAHVLGIDPAPEPARAVAEFARLLHALPQGANPRADARIATLLEHGTAVARFQTALAAVQPANGGVSLQLARAGKSDRKRLQDFLVLVGLKLRERKKQFSVERDRNREAVARAAAVADVGVDIEAIVSRLNAGETMRIEVPSDQVPIPFGPLYWSATFFRQKLEPRDILTAILLDRRASLLCRGLMALDEPTLTYFAAHPELVEDLDGSRAPAFGAFGQALVIHDGHVVPPGGAEALPLWEDALGESASRPDRFVRELFARDGGRVAYLYAVLASLDPDRRAFALGTWIADAALRRQRFRALVDASHASADGWEIEKRPFTPAPHDVALALGAVRVRTGGTPAEPAARKFWAKAFDGTDFPEQPDRELRNLDEDGVIDAAWLVEQVAAVEVTRRADRLEQLRFGQRVFGDTPSNQLGDALIATRAVVRLPILMQTLARTGARTPAPFAAAARRAAQITELGTSQAYQALIGFQGSIALVERLTRSGSLKAVQAEALIAALATLEPDSDGRLGAAVVAWLQQHVLSALSLGPPLTEAALIGAAAGVGHTATPLITWEGRQYRVDVASSDARRIARARQSQKGPSVESALALDAVRRRLASPTLALAEVKQSSTDLTAIAAQLAPVTLTNQERPPAVELPANLQQEITRAVRDLAKITRAQDVRKAGDQLRRLADVEDVLVAQALLNFTYAWSAADAEAQGEEGGVVAFRHHFGFGASGGEARVAMWSEPKPDLAPGRPWRVRGALLGLDVAFGPQALRRLSTDGAEAPVLGGNEMTTFVRSVSLLNPHLMHDAGQGAIAAALAQGRSRVAALPQQPDQIDRVLADARVDGWRARAVRWTLQEKRDGAAAYFSLVDLLRLGNIDAALDLSPWGVSQQANDGCLCTGLDLGANWWVATGRTQLGVLAGTVPDLHLRVAAALDELHLPAVLGKAVLASAAQTYIDRVRPSDDDDWFGLVRAAGAFPREAIEDAVASLVADGPLVAAPVDAPGAR